jgi:hypothetical protein
MPQAILISPRWGFFLAPKGRVIKAWGNFLLPGALPLAILISPRWGFFLAPKGRVIKAWGNAPGGQRPRRATPQAGNAPGGQQRPLRANPKHSVHRILLRIFLI